MAARGANLVSAQGLAPLVEEVAEREAAPDRRLDVDDAVWCVRLQPVEARPRIDLPPFRALGFLRPRDADPGGHLAPCPVHEDRQVGVDVKERVLVHRTANAVDGLTGGNRFTGT